MYDSKLIIMSSEETHSNVREPYSSVFSTLRRLSIFLKPHKTELLAISIMVVIVSALPVIPPLVIGMIFDRVILNATISTSERTTQLFGFIVIILLVELALLYFTYLKDIKLKKLGERLVFEIRSRIFSHLQGLSISFYDKKQAGTLVSRVIEESKIVEEMFNAGLGALFIAPLTFAGILCMMLWINWKLALLALLPVPFLYVTMLFFIKPIKNLYANMKEKDDELHSFLYESFSGVRVIKLFSRGGYEESRFDKKGGEIYDIKVRIAGIISRYLPLMGFIMSSGTLMVLLFGGLYSGSEGLTGGELVSFISYLAYLYSPLTAVTYSNHILQKVTISGKRILEILDEKMEVADGNLELDVYNLKGGIEFRDVSFDYGGKTVLDNVSFKVGYGERVGLVGETGAGKSTIAKLMVRFYDPKSGSVIIGGNDVRRFTLSSLRTALTMVLQDDFLFCDTIRNNLLFGGFDESEGVVSKVVSTIFGDSLRDRFPKCLDTIVGERGLSLSAGERQLLCIARALLRKPKVLILDEATSSLDIDTERRVLDNVFDELKDSTIVVISHRASALQNCERLLEVKDGEVFSTSVSLPKYDI